MNARRITAAVTAMTMMAAVAGCHGPSSEVGTNIQDAHDNAAEAIDNQADALDNKADALRNKASQTRDWGKDLKKEADSVAKHGGHPDEATLNQM